MNGVHVHFDFAQQTDSIECDRCCSCGINPYIAFVNALEEHYKKEAAIFRKGNSIDREKIISEGAQLLMSADDKRFDPLKVIHEAYLLFYQDNLEACLSNKRDTADCIYGCCCDIKDGTTPKPHPHQRRPYYRYYHLENNGFKKLANRVGDEKFGGEKFTDFDSIYKKIKDLSQDCKGVGPLAIYDASLRLAWHSNARAAMLPTKVYMHCGPLAAVEALQEISKEIHDVIITETSLKRPKKNCLEKEVFSQRLVGDGDLGAYHIENLLCIFHDMFERWESEIYKQKGLPQRKSITPFK